MARGVNKVILIGNLGRDPELTYTPSGLAIAKFSLATTEGRKNQEGVWTDHTEWHRIVIFGKTAETAGQYLTKGSQVFIEGRIAYGSYEREGVKVNTTDIIVSTMQMLGGKGGGGGESRGGGDSWQQPPKQQQQPPQQQQRNQAPPEFDEPSGQDYDEDLPF